MCLVLCKTALRSACCAKSLSHVWLFAAPWAVAHQAPLSMGFSDCQALLQGIFPTQGSNPGLLHCRQILYCLSHRHHGSPRILEWVAYAYSSRSSQPQELIIAPALQADFWPAELPGKPLDKHSQFLYIKEELLIIILRFM